MRKFAIILGLQFITQLLPGQNPPPTRIDSMLVDIDKSTFTSGILYDRTAGWANLSSFNDRDMMADKGLFEQAVQDLYLASNREKFSPVNTLRNLYTPDSLEQVVDVGILNATFHQLNYREDNVAQGALNLTANNRFAQLNNGKEVFLKREVFLASPLRTYARGETITYRFDPNLILQDTEGRDLVWLRVNFDTPTDYTVIQNASLQMPSIGISYAENGYKTITFTAGFADGSEAIGQSVIYITAHIPGNPPQTSSGEINASIPFQGYNGGASFPGKLEYRIFYHTNAAPPGLRKPLVVIDGFDPGDRRKIQDSDSGLPPDEHRSIEEVMVYYQNGTPQPLIPMLRSLGYDVVIVNHPTYMRNGQVVDGGADYIERNALTHVQLYQWLNNRLQQNGSNEQLVIVGPSMGGQISRYALSYMEKHGIAHNTRLWVSVDSPHLGANIPIGLQALLNQTMASGNVAAQDFVQNQLGSVAARQQLIEQYSTANGSQLGLQHMNGRTTGQGFGQNNGHPYYIQYYNNLFNNGLAGSDGYPQNVRRIALANGSLVNSKAFYNPFTDQQEMFSGNGQMGLNVRGFQEVCSPWPLCWDVHIASLEAFGMPTPNVNTKVSRFKAAFNDQSLYVTNNNSRGNMDNVPGGWFPGFNEVAAPVDGTDPLESSGGFWSSWDGFLSTIISLFSDLLGGAELNVYNNKYVHSFIPSVSALGFNNPNFNWNEDFDRDLTCTGEIPFDSYYGPELNEQHTSFTQASINWLLGELSGVPQLPTVYLKSGRLNGPYAICSQDIITYDFDNCVSPPVDNWVVSPNLQILSSTTNSVTVRPSGSNTSGDAYIQAVYPNHTLEKEVWIGRPDPAIEVNGPAIVNTGAQVAYHGSGAQGATEFVWWLPYPFDPLDDVRIPFDYNGANWQTWPNQGRSNYHIFTGMGGHNGLVQFFGRNRCGDGGAALKAVEHGSGGNCTNCESDIYPYPNEADSHFNLDFSSLPEGYYQIYLYNAYSNMVYQGVSSNIERIVSTLDLPEGIYYLHIHINNEVTIKQLMVNH